MGLWAAVGAAEGDTRTVQALQMPINNEIGAGAPGAPWERPDPCWCTPPLGLARPTGMTLQNPSRRCRTWC